MTTNNIAHHSFWQTSDFIFAIVFLLGLALHYVPTLTIELPLPATLAVLAGGILAGIGVVIIVSAKVSLKKFNQPAGPGQPTTQIVDTGIYHYSRNPIYLGLVFVLLGLGLAFSIAWWLVLVLPMMLAFKHILILPEEDYLREKFADEYLNYCRKVRRWL